VVGLDLVRHQLTYDRVPATPPGAAGVPLLRLDPLHPALRTLCRALTGLTLLTGCRDGAAVVRKDPRPPPAHGSIDSVFSRDESIRRFREGLPEVTGFTGGTVSRAALEQRFFRALKARDTAALLGLTLTQAEFAWLHYPTIPSGLSETGLRPHLMWMMLQENSMKGLRAVLDSLGGKPVPQARYHCTGPATEGANRIWYPCAFTRVAGPDTLRYRLFGPIIERDGQFKLVSLANTLD
jgi:hypothetical protein